MDPLDYCPANNGHNETKENRVEIPTQQKYLFGK